MEEASCEAEVEDNKETRVIIPNICGCTELPSYYGHRCAAAAYPASTGRSGGFAAARQMSRLEQSPADCPTRSPGQDMALGPGWQKTSEDFTRTAEKQRKDVVIYLRFFSWAGEGERGKWACDTVHTALQLQAGGRSTDTRETPSTLREKSRSRILSIGPTLAAHTGC